MAVKPTKSSKKADETPAPAPARRALAPRTRGYRFNQDGRGQSRLADNNLTIRQDGPKVEVVTPMFKKGRTVFRAAPALCAEDPTKCDPYRYSTDELDFTDWIRNYPVATYIGTASPKTVILYDPHDNTYERSGNPYVIFANNVINGVKKDGAGAGRWNKFVAGMTKDAVVKWPTTMYMMQGICFQNGDKVYVADGVPRGAARGDLPLILQLTKSAGEKLTEKLEIVNPDFTGADDDYEHMYKYGDPVSLRYGRFIHIFNPELASAEATGNKAGKKRVASWSVGKERADSGARGQTTISTYEVKLTKTFEYGGNVYYPKIEQADRENFRKKIQWWDDIIRIPTHEELCVIIAQAFADMPKMLEYAWSDHPEFFSGDVKKIMRSHTTMPGSDVPSEEDEDEEIAAGSARRKKSASLPDAEMADDEDEEVTPKAGRKKVAPPSDEEMEDEGLEDELDEDEDEEEDEFLEGDDDADEDVDEDEDEDEDVDEVDEDEDEDVDEVDEDEDEDEDVDADDDEDADDVEEDDVDEEEEEVDEDAEEDEDVDADDDEEEVDEDEDEADEEEEEVDEDDEPQAKAAPPAKTKKAPPVTDADLDADEAAMAAATAAAENRASLRDKGSVKKGAQQGKASASKEVGKKTDVKAAGKAPAAEKATVSKKDEDMAKKAAKSAKAAKGKPAKTAKKK